MKDQNPIKRHKALIAFSRDHHFGLLLVWKIKQGLANGIAPERISNYVLYSFENDLQPHFREEEHILFPLLPADNPLRQRAEHDHVVIQDMVLELDQDKTNKELLFRFEEKLDEHIRFEERKLFVYMQQTLPDEKLQVVITHGSSRKNEIDENWKDIFWVKHRSGL